MSNIMLLAGFPRSGTTWFANLINAHSDIIYRHELIGRHYHLFGEELFLALKNNSGLSDTEYYSVKNIVASAHVDTDKPPFFKKNHGLLRHPRLHHYAWLGVKTVPLLSTFYKKLFSLNEKYDISYLVKETRSLKNFDSIIQGLRASKIVFLVRKPEGAIYSHIKGIIFAFNSIISNQT